jgi:membrane protein
MIRAFTLLLRETVRQWDAHRLPKMDAALSFYTVFSMAPLAIIVLSLVNLMVEPSAARAEIVGQFRHFVGHEGPETIEMMLTNTAGSLIINLVWVLYTAQILFFSADFTRVFATRYGSHQSTDGVVSAG